MSLSRAISFMTFKGKSLLPQKRRPVVVANDLGPRLPFELIYKLIDDHIAPSKDLRTIRALAATCQILAAYCRALSFRVIHLEYTRPECFGPALSKSTFPCQGKPDRFLRLVQCSPHILEHIQSLSLHFDPDRRVAALRQATADEAALRQWNIVTDVLSLRYPNLRSLKIGGDWRYHTPVSVKRAIVNLLLLSHGLESLEIGLFCETPFHVLACIPSTVKHLTEHAIHPSATVGELVLDPALPSTALSIHSKTLDALTLTRVGGSPNLCTILSDKSPISLGSLKHLQIGECSSERCFDATCARIVSLCSNTLQCLHIGVLDYVVHNGSLTRPVADAPIPLAELRSLKVLEIRTDASLLKRTLQWLSNSIATIPPEETHDTMQRLKISILFGHTLCCGCLPCLKSAKFDIFQSPDRKTGVPPSWYLRMLSRRIGEDLQSDSSSVVLPSLKAMSPTAWHQKYWERAMSTAQESWPNLGLANFSLFLEHFNHETRCPLITDEPPMAFEHGDDYVSLWDECPCSGWRYQT